MSDSSIARTIRFQKPGVTPPVFLAGSFTEPEWRPVEMQSTRADDGGYIFQSIIHTRPGQDHQYKFRIGHSDDWVIDEDSLVGKSSNGQFVVGGSHQADSENSDG
jgi:hypothetical protein